MLQGIEELFPTETKQTYFIPYCKRGNSICPNRGKSYDKYCFLKKEIQLIGPNSNKRKHSEVVRDIVSLNKEGKIVSELSKY